MTSKIVAMLLPLVVIVIAGIVILSSFGSYNTTTTLKQFKSFDEMKSFIGENAGNSFYGAASRGMANILPSTLTQVAEDSQKATDYSQTNVQVVGVDEADIAKNDGKYIYMITGNNVTIVDAYPATDMNIASIISINKTVSQLFLNKDRLVVFASGYEPAMTDGLSGSASGSSGSGVASTEGIVSTDSDDLITESPVRCLSTGCGIGSYMSYVYIYDVTDRTAPVLKDTIALEGNYMQSRMIGDYVYVISSKYVGNEPVMPLYRINGAEKMIAPTEIYYYDSPDTSFAFNIITSVNTQTADTNVKVYLLGSSYTIYASADNIYLTGQKQLNPRVVYEMEVNDIFIPLLPAMEAAKARDVMSTNASYWEKARDVQQIVSDYSMSLTGNAKSDFDSALMTAMQKFETEIAKEMQRTVVHKISVNNGAIEYKASGEVNGNVLNQFSMDEYNGYFRIATTTGNTWNSSSSNNIFVLDSNLKVVGSITGLAPGESIYSARFIGDRAYLVTFQSIDPFFVIDLSNPTAPAVLGYLKLPGYSDYLQPYDETHIIGIGKDVNESIDADKVHTTGAVYYTAVQGVKVSLFDVSDVANPVETGKIVIGDRGTDSYALHDHKALLFDKNRNLLVLPISLAQLNQSRPGYMYGDIVWKGAYVLNIDTSGISVKGRITHNDNTTAYDSWFWYDPYSVQRSLYMDNTLYTVSSKMIKANDLTTLDEINKLNLPYSEEIYPNLLY